MTEKICVVCGRSFTASGRAISCSPECMAERRLQRQRSDSDRRVIYNREWRHKKKGTSFKENGNCEMCGKEFSILIAGQGNRKRCPECAEIFNDASNKMYYWACEIRSKFMDMCMISPQAALNFYTDMEREDGKEFAEKLLGRIKDQYLTEVAA